jgi:hypothetical protein
MVVRYYWPYSYHESMAYMAKCFISVVAIVTNAAPNQPEPGNDGKHLGTWLPTSISKALSDTAAVVSPLAMPTGHAVWLMPGYIAAGWYACHLLNCSAAHLQYTSTWSTPYKRCMHHWC